MAMTERDRQVAEIAWDAAVAAMRYEDGSPVEIVAVVNPYRASIEQSPKDLFYATLRGMNPSKELSAAIDRTEARE